MRFLLCSLVLALLITSGSSLPSAAASTPLYASGTAAGSFLMADGERRQTLLQVLQDVAITEFGVVLDTTNGFQTFQWQILLSNEFGSRGSVVYSIDVSYVDDGGMRTYNTVASTGFFAGTYLILELQNTSGSATSMELYPESTQGLPFTTADGYFRVLNGGLNNSYADSILPSFSLSAHALAIPEPSSALLIALGLIVLGGARRP